MGRSAPTKILIRSIGLRAWVDQVGLTSHGTVETPPYAQAKHAAWYRPGPSPGERGPAVIIGHVDSRTSVAVFFYLSRVRPGDSVEIVRADGRSAIFTVDSIERFAKTQFPTQRVYGEVDAPVLRLITCGGKFDAKTANYLDNIVVFARLTGTRAAGNATVSPIPGTPTATG
jgi:hypothetical protein